MQNTTKTDGAKGIEVALKNGLGVFGEGPMFLEAIAMALGHEQPNRETLAEAATRIANALERIAERLDA